MSEPIDWNEPDDGDTPEEMERARELERMDRERQELMNRLLWERAGHYDRRGNIIAPFKIY